MEADWSRQKPFDERSLVEIQLMLMEAGVDVASSTPIREGLANSNYLIRAMDGQKYVLRIHQAESSRASVLAALGQHLGDLIPIPKMIFHSEDGLWSLFSYLPGLTMQSLWADGKVDGVLGAARSIGETLAKIASFEFELAGEIDATLRVVRPWGNLFDDYYKYMTERSAGAYMAGRITLETHAGIDRVWQRARERLGVVMSRPCLCHADFKASNLLIDEGCLSGVLDWEFAHVGTWLLDAGQVHRYLGEHREAFAVEFEVGMRAGGLDVPKDWQELSRVVDTMNLVDFVNRPMMTGTQHIQLLNLLDESLAWLEPRL